VEIILNNIKYKYETIVDKENLLSRIAHIPQEYESEILSYLMSGNIVSEAPIFSPVEDIIDSQKSLGYVKNVYYDSIWVWNEALIYYVKQYHYRISDEFLTHIKKNNFQVPKKFRRDILK
jgi:hypothetical protein